MLWKSNRTDGAVCLAIALSGLLFAPQSVFGDGCSPEWVEEVGLSASYRSHVRDFVVYDDGSGAKLHAAGLLDFGPPNERTGAVRWNGEAWQPLEVQGVGNRVFSQMLTVYNGELVGAGNYEIDGVGYRVGRWDVAAQTWVPMSEPAAQSGGTFQGDAMVAFGGSLYIGGRHNLDVHGLNSAGFSRYDGEEWGPVPNLPSALLFPFWVVQDLIVFNNALYAAFGSDFFPGAVYRLEQDGGFWEKVGGDVPARSKLAVFQNQLHIAGTRSSTFQPPVVNHVLRLVSDQWIAIPSSIQNQFTFIQALVGANDGSGEALFIGGVMEDIGGVAVNHVAKWDGTSWSSLGSGVRLEDDVEDAMVWALFGWDDGSGPALFVGGEFDDVRTNGDVIPSSGIAKWACEPPAVDPVLSQVVASESAISSFGGQTRITVTPRDPAGELLDAGQGVFLFTDAGSLLGALMDEGDGTYRQDLQAVPGPSGASLSAIVNGVELEQIAHVAFVPVEPNLSTIDVSMTQTFVGGSAVVTVTLRDDQSASAGSGFDVQLASTLGQLVGSVVDHGDGTYSQTILADGTGTANITATADGMALNTSAALTVLDPTNYGNIIGCDASGDAVGHLSIQAAIDSAPNGCLIYVTPGVYNETILLDGANGVTLEGLSAFDPVVVRGVVISESSGVSLRFLTIDPDGANRPRDAVELRGGARSSSDVEILGTTIVNAAANGVFIGAGNEDVRIIDSVIASNGRHGIETRGASGEHLIANSVIADNGWTGIEVDRDVVLTIAHNVITGNGASFNSGNPNGYGISRSRKGGSGTPQDVTLIQNTLEDNNGRVQGGRSDSNVGNYDQVIDATDDQSPYTD